MHHNAAPTHSRNKLRSASYVAVNTTLPASAADRRAALDMDRTADTPAADAPYRLSAGPTAANLQHAVAAAQDETDRQTDTGSLQRPCRILCEQCP